MERGLGCRADAERAAALYRRGALLRYSGAYFNYAVCLSDGFGGVAEDEAESLRYCAWRLHWSGLPPTLLT